jgi:hypothetical protein
MARSIVVQIIGDAAQLEREFKRAGDATDKFGKRMGVSLKSMGKAGLAGVAVGGTALLSSCSSLSRPRRKRRSRRCGWGRRSTR